MKKIFLIAPALLLLACGGEQEAENNGTEEQVVEEVIEEVAPEMTKEEEMQAYIADNGWEAVKDESGMYVVIDEPGEGDTHPTLDDEVTIFYHGYLLDGYEFDGTENDETPASFPLRNLIPGWQIGIPYFAKGGKGKLIIPSDLAYGDFDYGDIPGGSTLMFEISLIDWQPAQ